MGTLWMMLPVIAATGFGICLRRHMCGGPSSMSRLEGEAHSWTLSPLEICLEPITVKNNLRIDRCLFGFSARVLGEGIS